MIYQYTIYTMKLYEIKTEKDFYKKMEENTEKVSFKEMAFENISKIILGKKVFIKNIIDWNTQQYLIASYLERMFGEYDNPFGKYSDTNRFLAETAFRSDFVKEMTNIDITSLPEGILLNDDSFFDKCHGIAP